MTTPCLPDRIYLIGQLGGRACSRSSGWRTQRIIESAGARVSGAADLEELVVPAPQALERLRMRALDELGPGWLQEHLVHHV